MLKTIVICLALIPFACAHLPPVEAPYFTIHFPGLDFFIEGEGGIGAITVPSESGLLMIPEEGHGDHYIVKGSGLLRIRDYDCNWNEGTLTCGEFDLTHFSSATGGVVLKRKGEFVAVNPLTVFAK